MHTYIDALPPSGAQSLPPVVSAPQSSSPPLSCDTFGSPGSPPSTPSTSDGFPSAPAASTTGKETQQDLMQEDASDEPCHGEPLPSEYEALRILCKKQAAEITYYREQVNIKETEKAEMYAKCQRKISRIRSFWTEEIFYGNTRSGRILRAALINNAMS